MDALLRDTYLEMPTDEEQKAFFAHVARTVFERVLDAPADPRGLLEGLVRGVEERRFLLWSKQPAEQEAITGTAIASEVPANPSRRPEVGVYVNDPGADKLTYYLDHRVDVRPRSCGSNGNQILDVRLTMRSAVPPGELTPFVVGPGSPGLAAGDMRLTSYLYAPVGGRIDEATLDGEPVTLVDGVDRGREVGALTTDIGRGSGGSWSTSSTPAATRPGDRTCSPPPASAATGSARSGGRHADPLPDPHCLHRQRVPVAAGAVAAVTNPLISLKSN